MNVTRGSRPNTMCYALVRDYLVEEIKQVNGNSMTEQ
jgi:hypothetical protein